MASAYAPAPRRAFGSGSGPSRVPNGHANGSADAGSSSSGGSATSGVIPASTSSTALTNPSDTLPLRPQPRRQRSQSSASAGASAAERASQWLSALAPRGEGRGREFLTNTLSGVATVATTVGHEVGGLVASARQGAQGPRPNSWGQAPEHAYGAAVPQPPQPRVRRLGAAPSAGSVSSSSTAVMPYSPPGSATPAPISPNPPPPASGARSPSPPRRPPQPANVSRLGGSSTSARRLSSPARFHRPSTAPPPGAERGHARTGSTSSIGQPHPGTGNDTALAVGPGSVHPPGPRGTSPALSAQSATSAHSAPSSGTTPTGPNGQSTIRPGRPLGRGHGHAHSNSASATYTLHTQIPGSSTSASSSPAPTTPTYAQHGHRHSASSIHGIPRARAGMPYKIGFQPSGVRRDRTEEYVEDRKALAAERDKEEGRLGRRWAKLVDLHFNPTLQTAPGLTRSSSSSFSLSQIASGVASSVSGVASGVAGAASGRRPLLSMDGALDSLKPREVWKGIKAAAGPGPEEARKRAAEQGIVKWEDDGEVRKCRICLASFSLSTRKHHCRLCGRIVCSLPPTPPALLAVQTQVFSPADPGADPSSAAALPPGTRRDKCSLLLVADWKTGRGEEVDEGFVGWMTVEDPDKADKEGKDKRGGGDGDTIRAHPRPTRAAPARSHRRNASALSGLSDASALTTASGATSDTSRPTTPLPQQPQEVQVRGVRVCRECWAVVGRKQRMADRARVTPMTRLYHALRALQGDIDGLLPEFEELLAASAAAVAAVEQGTTTSEVGTTGELDPDLLDTHRVLLTLLGQYDAVAKRISALACAEGSAQATVQSSLARSAATFLARAMVTVQALPKLQRRAASARAQRATIVESRLPDVLRAEGVRADEADDVAARLQPLLEQQAQLESFIAEANAQRKYDDARSLAQALGEIEQEIGHLTAKALG